MLNIFRQTRKHNSGNSHRRNYVFYAIGEIALVVVGIVIALQIDNWNNQRIESKIEREILKELRASLNNDLLKYQHNKQHIKQIEEKVSRLQTILTKGESSPDIDSLFGAVYGILRFEVNTASYEELKSHGINLISDDDIRRLTVRIYDTHLKLIQHMNKIEDSVILEALRPFYLQNFTHIRFSETATAKNLEEILQDDYFLNLVDYRLTVLRSQHFNTYPQIIADMSELLNRIDQFLEE